MAKVISVGNISMGGTGKTPHTIMLAKEYLKRTERVAILSLGYKGKLGYESKIISDGEKVYYTPPMAADEPYMMGLACKGAAVITGRNRQASLDIAVENFGTTIAILDDAYQHHKIKKDVEILLLDHKNPISTGLPFPFGYLREMPSAIRRADIVIFTRAENETIPERTKCFLEDKPVFFSRQLSDYFVFDGMEIATNIIIGSKIVAYSAVASNNEFYNTLQRLNLNPVYFKGFKDHRFLDKRNIIQLLNKAEQLNADRLITTEKDFIKLPPEYQKYFGYLKISVSINNKNSLFNTIDNILNF